MNDGRVCARCCVRVCLCACVYVCVMHVGEAVFQLVAPRGQFPFRSPPVRACVRACGFCAMVCVCERGGKSCWLRRGWGGESFSHVPHCNSSELNNDFYKTAVDIFSATTIVPCSYLGDGWGF